MKNIQQYFIYKGDHMFLGQLKQWVLLVGSVIFFFSSIAMAKSSEENIQTPHMKAAYEGDVVAMKKLLEQGVNPDQSNKLVTKGSRFDILFH